MIRCWRLDDSRQSLILGSRNDHLAEVVYWGPRLPDREDLETIYRANAIDVTGGMLDANPELSVCPEATRTFPGQPGLILRDGAGKPLVPKFRYASEEVGENRITLTFRDEANGLTYHASFSINPRTHVIEARAVLDCHSPAHLDWLSAPVFPGPQLADEVIDFSGRWCGEFQMHRTPWSPGMRYRENRTGRTGHEHFPGLLLPCRGATNTAGEVYAFHYGWSGGHRMIAEELPDGRRQVQFGNAAWSETNANRRFETGALYAVYSDHGINGCAVAFQRHLRDEIVDFPHLSKPRPVHYNCWEAVYFDHNLAELKSIAELAAELGAERFVLDDGWFGNRDDDTRALSDWEVDPRKYPDGLRPLIDHVRALGMTFGIWFEPEMINPDSGTYRAHPEWALGDEDQILGRHQKALNMALPEVQEYLFERIGKILGDHEIDFGILKRTHRVWLSDSNDAIERLRMQHNGAIFLPMAVTGSHVGPRVCHTSGRTLDIGFRAWVAAQRHMGFEMDPRELTEEETGVLKAVTRWWKDNRTWMFHADILRLDSPDPAVVAEQHLAPGGGRFVVFAGKQYTSQQIAPRPLRLTRLTQDAMYRVSLKNRSDVPELSRGDPMLKSGSVTLSGAYLMSHGLTLPWSFPETMWVVEGTRV